MELNQLEQRIIEHLSSRGGSSAGSIARLTGVKRPSVYAALERLISLGIVRQRTGGRAAEFLALPAKDIKQILANRAQIELQNALKSAADLEFRIRQIERNTPQRIAGYEIRAIETREAVYSQMEISLQRGNYSAFFNPQLVCVGEFKEVIVKFLREGGKHSPHIREICVAGPVCDWYVENIRNPNHKVKETDPATNIRSDMMMIDGSVIISHYSVYEELAIKITQPDYFASMMAIFENIWVTARGKN